MTSVLLATGSRSLARIPGAEAWARAILRDALAGVDLLIVGDAEGQHTAGLAERAGITVRREVWT